MKNKASLPNKVYRKIHWIIFTKLKPGPWIRAWYPAYRHGMRFRGRKGQDGDGRTAGERGGIPDGSKGNGKAQDTVYLTQVPNEGAGIGHQLANYIGGVHYAQVFGVRHAHAGFKDRSWEAFFGFGEGEMSTEGLKRQGYKMLRLPYFDEEADRDLILDIIASYQGEKVILQTELDQFYQKQYEVIPFIKEKFEHASARKEEKQPYDGDKINIAVHIRRGDIVEGQVSGAETLTKRWLAMEYYENAVSDIVDMLYEEQENRLNKIPYLREKLDRIKKNYLAETKKETGGNAAQAGDGLQEILKAEGSGRKEEEGVFDAWQAGWREYLHGHLLLHLFSQGKQEDYRQFERFAPVHYCLDTGAKESFLMMVRSDVLVISKSSFSYKPALLADGVRICPPEFWHGYPEDENWVVADKDGGLKRSLEKII